MAEVVQPIRCKTAGRSHPRARRLTARRNLAEYNKWPYVASILRWISLRRTRRLLSST